MLLDFQRRKGSVDSKEETRKRSGSLASPFSRRIDSSDSTSRREIAELKQKVEALQNEVKELKFKLAITTKERDDALRAAHRS